MAVDCWFRMSRGHVQSASRVSLQQSRNAGLKTVSLSSFKSSTIQTPEVEAHKDTREQVFDLLESIGIPGALVLERNTTGRTSKFPSVDQVAANLRIMVDVMKIHITDIKDVVKKYPDLLFDQKPEDLMDAYDVLLAAWPSEAQLRSSIRAYPMILGEDFASHLQKSLGILLEIGFESKQAARMIVKQPDIVMLRKFELNNVIKRFSLDIDMEDEDAKKSYILEFFSRNPEAMAPHYFKNVLYKTIHRMHDEIGMSLSASVLAVIRHDKVYKKCIHGFDSIKSLVKRMSQYCGGQSQAVQIVEKVPQILSMDLSRLDQSLHVMQSLNIDPDTILSYPRIFLHNPHQVVGPRILFMEENWSGKNLQLATFLSIGEQAFVSKYVGTKRKAYDNALEKYAKLSHTNVHVHVEPSKKEEKQQQPKSGKTPQLSQSQQKPAHQKRFWKKRMKRLPRISTSS